MSLDVTLTKVKETEIFEMNVTHNLVKMADAAGIYTVMWHPEKLNIKYAGEIIPTLKIGLKDLKERPEYFKTFNPNNGWGTYDIFVVDVEKYLKACEETPDAKVYTSV